MTPGAPAPPESSFPVGGPQPTGVALRFSAIVVDLVVTIPLFVVFVLLWGETSSRSPAGNTGFSYNLTGWPYFGYLMAMAGYYAACEGTWGATLGKRVVGIRVVQRDGSRISWGQAVIRNLLRLVDILPVFYLVGAISVWVTEHNQRIGDKVADTVVVSRATEQPVTPGHTGPFT